MAPAILSVLAFELVEWVKHSTEWENTSSLQIYFDSAMRPEDTSAQIEVLICLLRSATVLLSNEELCTMLYKSKWALNSSEITTDLFISKCTSSWWNLSIYCAIASFPLWRFSNRVGNTSKCDDVRANAERASNKLIIRNALSPWFIKIVKVTPPKQTL